MNDPATAPQIIILCSDMLFLSKITGVAKLLDFSFCTALSSKKAVESLSDELRQLLLIDLNTPALDFEKLAAAHLQHSHFVSVAFGPHVDVELLEQAKIAGCTQVLPRSQFSASLSQILTAALTEDADQSQN